MPIFYPPEYLQQAVTGPNPVPNLGGAFDSFFQMALKRQESAQDTLKMLLQSVPETGGQRASVAASVAAEPEAMEAMDPAKARLFRKRGKPTEQEAVTGAFGRAYAKLPNKPMYDPAQLRQTITDLSTAARESGQQVAPDMISKWAGNVASGQMPQEPEFWGLMTSPQTKHLGLETLYSDLIQARAREQGKVLTPEEVLAATKEFSKARSDPQQMALLRQNALQATLDYKLEQLKGLKERNKAYDQGAILTPAEEAKYREDEQLITSRLSAISSVLKQFDKAASGDQQAQASIMMTISALSRAGSAGDRAAYIVLFQNAIDGNYTPEARAMIETLSGYDQEALKEIQHRLTTKRGPAPAGATAPGEEEVDPDDALADEILKALTESEPE